MTVLRGVISYPIPPYSNVPIQPQFYQPSVFVISAVTLGTSTTVTTAVNHNYVVGQLVRLLIPVGYGCTQLNDKSGYVTSIPAPNQVVVAINSTQANAFISASLKQQPQIKAIGDVNTGATNANGRSQNQTFIPGSFIDIS
jgi:hypothetical protein